MSRCRCDPITVSGCLCSFGESNCWELTGNGTPGDPVIGSPKLDPSLTNLLTCGIAGLLGELPEELRNVPSCIVYQSTSQLTADNTTLIMPFNFEEVDTDSMHTGSNDFITVNTSGLWHIEAKVNWDASDSGECLIALNHNGVGIADDRQTSLISGHRLTQALSRIRHCDAGDTLELAVRQVTGGPLNVAAISGVSPLLAAVRVGNG